MAKKKADLRLFWRAEDGEYELRQEKKGALFLKDGKEVFFPHKKDFVHVGWELHKMAGVINLGGDCFVCENYPEN